MNLIKLTVKILEQFNLCHSNDFRGQFRPFECVCC